MKRYKITVFLLTGILLLPVYYREVSASESITAEESDGIQQQDSALQDMFTDRDMDMTYEDGSSVKIELLGETASCALGSVQIDGTSVTITEEGTYVLSGTLENGIIIIDAENAKVQLVLDGAKINNSELAAVYVREADKVFVTTTEGSENLFINRGTYTQLDDNNIDAVIFSKSDLTLNGNGTLKITAEEGHGIVSKDDLVLTGGTYEITAGSHGLSGKDSVRIAGGKYSITSGKDGIHAENSDDESLGYVYLKDGSFFIQAEGDGISAQSWLQADGGAYELLCGQGSENVSEKNQEDSASTKGIKAGTELTVNGGEYKIDSQDDSIHSNGDVLITAGEFEMSTGDDGIHGDAAVAIQGGTIEILESYEGIEGLSLEISGGEITLKASDDGLNAAGGNDSSGFGGRGGDQFAAQEGVYINISGGTLYVNASGDGIDSNGDLTVSGGETYVSGPTDNNNGALDYNGEAVISGGIFIAAGSSGMAENFGNSSTQGVIMTTVDSQEAGSKISLSDSSGSELISWAAEKEYSSVIVSCPEIVQGEEYTLTAGEESQQITMDSLVYGEAGGMRGMGRQGWNQEMQNGFQKTPEMRGGEKPMRNDRTS